MLIRTGRRAPRKRPPANQPFGASARARGLIGAAMLSLVIAASAAFPAPGLAASPAPAHQEAASRDDSGQAWLHSSGAAVTDG
ncbi:hypothetical protein [Sandaracinobacteroides saxicola]|uniref:Uncharacterized protein n=1 Tax=Sandaracinobacteroides saxicola TaxID=2759707 RepID=A0A7G5IG34_9SPHN|nr:hypothetical protein [Sandaracinobacteroides saxicola]QMW22326.1 hypothetical protein H3309_13330 [Sandaracinobacteroides saxicola]